MLLILGLVVAGIYLLFYFLKKRADLASRRAT